MIVDPNRCESCSGTWWRFLELSQDTTSYGATKSSKYPFQYPTLARYSLLSDQIQYYSLHFTIWYLDLPFIVID